MSEYFVGKRDDDPEAALRGGAPTSDAAPRGRHAAAPTHGRHAAPAGPSTPTASAEPEHVRFGIPFNGVVPIWHDDATITWHRPLEDMDLSTVFGLGVVETEPGPAVAPDGWEEQVETGTLLPPGTDPEIPDALVLRLRPAAPTGRRAVNSAGAGAAIPLGPELTIEEAMGPSPADFDITGFSVHVARLMLRAARDGAILLFTMRAPRDPEPHHLLSMPSEVDDQQVMHFHMGTMLEMEGGAWDQAAHADGMALLDLDVPYAALLDTSAPEGEQALQSRKLYDMAQPAVEALLKPNFPFALGFSFVMPRR